MAKTKRTISPEHLAAMQAGRERARNHQKRVSQLSELDSRLQRAAREDEEKPIRRKNRRHRRKR